MKQTLSQRAIRFPAELIRASMNAQRNESFLDITLQTLELHMGYSHTLMASLSSSGIKALSPNLVPHNVEESFVSRFFGLIMETPYVIDMTKDLFLLSADPDYKYSPLYRNVLRPSGYSDMILQFVRAEEENKYLSYIIYLNTGCAFTADDADIISALSSSLAYCHLNNIYTWDMNNRLNVMTDVMNYYPLGIMLIADSTNIIYTNEIARQYLAELNVSDPRLYNMFYTSRVYPHFINYLRSRKSPLPLRIGNYLFNVISTYNVEDALCPAHDVFQSELKTAFSKSDLASMLTGLTNCVYIVHSDVHEVRLSASIFQDLGLTKRQNDVIEYVAKGYNNQEIADAMGVSINTVKTHLSTIYQKLGINYRTELVNIIYQSKQQ